MYAPRLILQIAAIVGAAALMGCATPQGRGAFGGSAVGAGTGAIIGAATGGNPATGALIGAGIGALTGAIAGDAVDRERRYNRPVYVYNPPPPPPPVRRPAHFSRSYRVEEQPRTAGHYETRLVRGPSGEYYEERVWVPDR
jgi:hypothetical protein